MSTKNKEESKHNSHHDVHHYGMNDRVFNQSADRLKTPERIEKLEVAKVVDLCLEADSIKSVIDIGTGSGLFAEEFSDKGLKTAGVDLNENMLEEAKKYVSNGTFKLGKAEKIPFENDEFDLAIFGLVFHEVDDYKKSLEEAGRVASKRIAILEWNYKDEEFGPPLKHRLKEEFILNLCQELKLDEVRVIKLSYLVLYIIDK